MFYREPILISHRNDGLYVAHSLFQASLQVVAVSRAQARKLFEQKLQREMEKEGGATNVEVQSATMEMRSFETQPMRILEHRRFPAGPPISIPVRIIRIKDEYEKLFGILPDYNLQFYSPDEESFLVTMQDMIRSYLSIATPEEIAHFWPPSNSELEWVRVHIATAKYRVRPRVYRTLSSVAEPLVGKQRPMLPTELRVSELRQIQDQMKLGQCLVVGETGVGKSILLKIAAREIERQLRAEGRSQASGNRAVSTLPRYWLSSASRLIAGMRYLGQWQARLERVVAELSEIQGVLVIENLRDLITHGGCSPQDSLGAFLLPYLRSGQLRLVSETTPAQLDYCQRFLPALVDELNLVRVAPMEPGDECALARFIMGQRWGLPANDIDVSVGMCVQRLSKHYLNSRPSPSGSVPFIEQWIGGLRTKASSKELLDADKPKIGDANELTSRNAILSFSKWTGLPPKLLDDDYRMHRDEVVAELAKDVIGQPEACHAAADIVLRLKSSLNDPARPFGCLLLCGPTGVGKTQLAKSLSKYLFGADSSAAKLIRLDMSEYQSVAAGYRFLNDSEGNSAPWIQRIRNQPLQVVLFDEIEKASPEVFDILLSLLDEGRLTDRSGNVVSFRSAVVLMTSNLGATQKSLSAFHGVGEIDFANAVRKNLRPEFINRLDAVVPFHSLTRENIEAMTRKELLEIESREGIKALSLSLRFGDKLVAHLADIGFSPTLGARPLQRTIESVVVSALAKWIVETMPRNGAIVNLDWDNERMTLVS